MPKVIIEKHKRDPADFLKNITVRIPPKMREQAVKLDLNLSAIARSAIGKAVKIEMRNRKKAQAITPGRSIAPTQAILAVQGSEKKEEVDQPLPAEVNHSYGCAMADEHTEIKAAPGESGETTDREVATQ